MEIYEMILQRSLLPLLGKRILQIEIILSEGRLSTQQTVVLAQEGENLLLVEVELFHHFQLLKRGENSFEELVEKLSAAGAEMGAELPPLSKICQNI